MCSFLLELSLEIGDNPVNKDRNQPLISEGDSNLLVRAMRPGTLVAQGYRGEVDHPTECSSAVGAHGIENQKCLHHGKNFPWPTSELLRQQICCEILQRQQKIAASVPSSQVLS